MRKTLFLLLVLALATPALAADMPPPGTPGHMDPYGKYMVDHHVENQKNGWQVSQHRSAFDEDNTFIFQLYNCQTGDENQRRKIEFYWTVHEVGEVLDTIGPYYGIEFSRYWPAASGESRMNIFSNDILDAPVTIVRSLKPFDRDIISIDIENYSLVNTIDVPEGVIPWSIVDFDKDGIFELVCVHRMSEESFPTRNTPHYLSIYKRTDGKWAKANNCLTDVVDRWDEDLKNLAINSKDDSRVEFCASLALSYIGHYKFGKTDEVVDILLDGTGYFDGKPSELAIQVSEILKESFNR